MHEVGEGREFRGVGKGSDHAHVDRGAVGSDETTCGFDTIEQGLLRGLFGCPAARKIRNSSERKEKGPFPFLAIQVTGAADQPAKRDIVVGSGKGGYWARESLIVADVPHAVRVPESNLANMLFAIDRDAPIISGYVYSDSCITQG